MTTNVNKMVGEALDKVKSVLTEAIQKADAQARGELMAQFNKAIGSANGTKTGTVTAAPAKRRPGRPRKNPEASAAPVKRRPGRPRKNPAPETAAAATETNKATKKAKVKRIISEEARQKLAENLRKAREAKAAKVKPAKRKAKAEGETAPATAQA